MDDQTSAAAYSEQPPAENYGLHQGVLGPIETLAQSVSAVAPSTTPATTIPIIFALVGNATWLVYLLAMCAMLLVGFCVNRFARMSASPGSLYTYTAKTLPPVYGAVSAWALLLAYVATGASVAGGAVYYANALAQPLLHITLPAPLVLGVVCAAAGYIAYRDVKLSAEVMLWIEVASVALVLLVLAAFIFRFGLRMDWEQFQLKGFHLPSMGPSLVLAIFSFVGFESATSLGTEVRNPLHTIPRTVILCAFLIGAFFILCSYLEVMGFHRIGGNADSGTSPLHHLAGAAGVAPLGAAIDFFAMVSMFACVLACTTAASRLLIKMAHSGLIPRQLEHTNKRHGTPGAAVVLATFLMFAGPAVLALCSFSALDIYDLCGSLSVFGFLTTYALMAVALPFARRAAGRHSTLIATISIATVLVMVLIAVFDLQSATDIAHGRILPAVYLAYILLGLLAYPARRKGAAA